MVSALVTVSITCAIMMSALAASVVSAVVSVSGVSTGQLLMVSALVSVSIMCAIMTSSLVTVSITCAIMMWALLGVSIATSPLVFSSVPRIMLQAIDVKNSSSAGATSFSDLTLLSNDIPAVASCEEELELHISDEDDEMLGQSFVLLVTFLRQQLESLTGHQF